MSEKLDDGQLVKITMNQASHHTDTTKEIARKRAAIIAEGGLKAFVAQRDGAHLSTEGQH